MLSSSSGFMRAWYVLLFPFLSAPQYHLVCQDQRAQHPVPLRHITPDQATLCSQGAIQQRGKLELKWFICGEYSCTLVSLLSVFIRFLSNNLNST